MRVLGVLAAWGVLAVLATMCFALGGSMGYRRGVKDTLDQIRERRAGKAGCRPLPANHLRRRSSGHARPGARARRARWRVGPVTTMHRTPSTWTVLRSNRWTSAAAASMAAVLLVGVPGTAMGATTSQPGESLWKVKLGLERVRVVLTTGHERDARVHVDLASVRLAELGALAGDEARPEVVSDVSHDLRAHTMAANHDLRYVSTRATRTWLQERIRDLTEQQVALMGDLANADCDAGQNRGCVALGETLEDAIALRDGSADTVRVVPTRSESATVVASQPAVAQADADAAPTQQASRPADDAPASAAAEAPDDAPKTAAASAAPSSAATPAPSKRPAPTAAPTPATPPAGASTAGSGTPEEPDQTSDADDGKDKGEGKTSTSGKAPTDGSAQDDQP